MKYRITGDLTLSVDIEVEADSQQDARDQIEMVNINFDDDSAICHSIDISSFDEEDSINLNLEKWEEMSKQERIEYLKEKYNMDDDDAYQNAGLDSFDIDEELLEKLEIE